MQTVRSGHNITINRHELGLDRPVSAPSNCLFIVLPSRPLSSSLLYSTIFRILLLLILITCRSQFELYLFIFSPTASTFNSPKISSGLVWSKSVHSAVLVKNFISVDENRFVSFFLKMKISLPFKRMGTASALHIVRSGNNISAMSYRPQFVRTYVVWTSYLKRIGKTNARNTMGRHCRNVFVCHSRLRIHVKFGVNTVTGTVVWVETFFWQSV